MRIKTTSLRDLAIINKGDAKQRIVKHLSGEPVQLTAEEVIINSRWEYANDLMVAKEKSWVQIRDMICSKFKVSKHTAENDMASTQEVYGRIHRVNKAYLLHLHAERIDGMIQAIKKSWITKKKSPDAKEIAALAKLNETYTYTVNCIPETSNKQPLPPPIMVFKLVQNTIIQQPLSLADAMVASEKYITDIEHEVVPNA